MKTVFYTSCNYVCTFCYEIKKIVSLNVQTPSITLQLEAMHCHRLVGEAMVIYRAVHMDITADQTKISVLHGRMWTITAC